MKTNIKKGDTVKVIAGKNRGKSGKVLHVYGVEGRVSVEGLNLHKRHVRPKKQGEKGEIVEVAAPFALSNAMLVCPACGKAARVGVKRSATARRRVCKKCNHEW